jgi:hypothetical protein
LAGLAKIMTELYKIGLSFAETDFCNLDLLVAKKSTLAKNRRKLYKAAEVLDWITKA